MALAGALRVFGLRCHVWFLLCLFGAVARRDFGPQLTKRFLNFLARCIGHGRNWASLIRRQLSGGHDDALDVRARLGENALHIKFFAHGSSYAAGRPFHIIAVHQEPCTNAGNAAVLGLAQGAVLLAPTENAFDRPAALLRQAITCMACGAAIDRASSQLAGLGRALVLRHMRCDIDGTQGRDMITRVIGLVGARREAMADGLALGFQHRVGSAAFRCSSLYLILQTVPFWRWPVRC